MSEPEARECDDCGIEDGARWDVGIPTESGEIVDLISVCDGCKDNY